MSPLNALLLELIHLAAPKARLCACSADGAYGHALQLPKPMKRQREHALTIVYVLLCTTLANPRSVTLMYPSSPMSKFSGCRCRGTAAVRWHGLQADDK